MTLHSMVMAVLIWALATSCDGVGVQSNGRVGIQPSSNSSTGSNRDARSSQNVALESDRGADSGRGSRDPIDAAGS